MFQEMKKFMMAIAVMVMAICATAQTVEKSDVFDNTEIGIKGGVSALVHPECNGYESPEWKSSCNSYGENHKPNKAERNLKTKHKKIMTAFWPNFKKTLNSILEFL